MKDLACLCGVAVARLREGLRSPLFLSSEMVSDLCRTLELTSKSSDFVEIPTHENLGHTPSCYLRPF